MKKVIIFTMILLLIWAGGFFCGRYSYLPPEPLSAKSDTITLRDTIKVAEPKLERVINTKLIPYPVAMFDTVHDTIFLPREVKSYRDSTYFAIVSGIDPELEYIETYNLVSTITNNIVTEKPIMIKPKWSLGFQAGMGTNVHGLSPYIGIGIQYNLLSW